MIFIDAANFGIFIETSKYFPSFVTKTRVETIHKFPPLIFIVFQYYFPS